MEIQTLEITKINPAKYNPRKDLQPEDAEYQKLRKSITEFDMVEPLVWNKRTGNLVGGHQRLKILKEMGIEKVEVSVVDLSEVKEKALNLALNKISGEWDFPRLKDLLEELDVGAFDIEITGFDLKEIEDLMTQFHVPEEGLTDDDAVPEPTESICKKGDLWQLGTHRLLCGDTTVITDLEKLMGGEKADMVFTDPPYGVGYDGGAKKRDKLEGDEIGTSIYADALPLLQVAASNHAALYLWYADAHVAAAAAAAAAAGYIITAQIIWIKNNAQFVSTAHYHGKHEPCFYAHRKGNANQWFGGKNEVTVWEVDRANKNEYHPTQKPVALAERAINNSSKVKQIVLDLFGGSGSTLIACEKLGRRCFMMEISEMYSSVIIKRWEDYTSQQAVRINGN